MLSNISGVSNCIIDDSGCTKLKVGRLHPSVWKRIPTSNKTVREAHNC